MLTADQVFHDFVSLLPSQAIELHRLMYSVQENDDKWTRWIKDCFEQIGRERGLEVKRTDSAAERSEFLFDLCWIQNSNNEYGMQLALECEWQEYLSDFKKLIHAKAPVKVLVFAWKKPEQKIEEVRQWISRSQIQLPEEQYLLINLPDSYDVKGPSHLTFTGDIFSSQGKQRVLPSTTVPLQASSADVGQ